MKNPKKHVNALIILAMILLSPLLLLAAFFFLPYGLYQNLKEKKKYLESPYYQKFRVPYRPGLPDQAACRFYNEAVSAGFDPAFAHQADGLDYLILADTVYVLQLRVKDFQALCYSDELGEWRVLAAGDAGPLSEAWEKCVSGIEAELSGKELRLLLEREKIWPRDSEELEFEEAKASGKDLALELLPSYVTVVEHDLDILGGTK